jgi:hypothetical protein
MLGFIGGLPAALALLAAVANCGPCADFSVGKCNSVPAEAQLIPGGIPMPNGPFAISSCQTTCQSYPDCEYFKYQQRDERCYILNERFLHYCDEIGGGDYPPPESCIDNAPIDADECDWFFYEDCSYRGHTLITLSSFDSGTCQDLLNAVGFGLGATYFVYDRTRSGHECRLLSSKDKSCTAINGPQTPNYELCSPPKNCLPDLMDWDCCTTQHPCPEGQGDCDADDECMPGLYCPSVADGDGFDLCTKP